MTAPKKTPKMTNEAKTQVIKTRPTKEELEQATKKVLAQYAIAVKNLARR